MTRQIKLATARASSSERLAASSEALLKTVLAVLAALAASSEALLVAVLAALCSGDQYRSFFFHIIYHLDSQFMERHLFFAFR